MPIEGPSPQSMSQIQGDTGQTQSLNRTESKAKLSTGQTVTNETKASGSKMKAKLGNLFNKVKEMTQAKPQMKTEELGSKDEFNDFQVQMETGYSKQDLQRTVISANTLAFGADRMIAKFEMRDGQQFLSAFNTASAAVSEENQGAVNDSLRVAKQLVDFCANPTASSAPDLQAMKQAAQAAEDSVTGSGDLLAQTMTSYIHVNVNRAIKEMGQQGPQS